MWDDTIDDLQLSQVADFVEAEDSLNNMSLTQTVNLHDINSTPSDFNIFSENASSLTNPRPKERFGPVFQEDDIERLKASVESKNTRKNTSWSQSTFNDWRTYRHENTGENVPEIEDMTESDINKWLSRFVLEARRKDGAPYPPRSLYQLSVGLLRHMRENGNYINFLDEKNAHFYPFRKTLSARMAELTVQGIGTVIKQADPITKENECLLWERQVLGNGTAKSLLYTVFFYNCKLFGLRGVDEHRNLSIDQFQLSQEGDIDSLTFNGRASKTYKGGLNQRHLTAKVIHHVFTDALLFNIYTEYIQLVSAGIDGQLNSPFYMRPLDNKNGMKQFSTQCVDVNKLSTLMKSMCAEAGITCTFTNHSGKRTCATQLYQTGIEEQEIICRTGHRSVNSVRKYKRPSSEIMREISNVLEPPKKSNVS